MSRFGLGVLLSLLPAAIWGQTTNCLVYPGGVVQCSSPQGLTTPPSPTNCQVGNGMIRCSQPQGITPVAPLPSPPPMPVYRQAPLPAPQNPSLQQPQYQQLQFDQTRERLRQEQQELDRQQQQLNSRVEPDDIVLKAAYCSGVISAQMESNKSTTASLLSSSRLPDAMKAEVKQFRDDQEVKLDRVNAYVQSRLPSLDPEPLITATNQGHADWPRTQKQTEECYRQCPKESPGGFTQCAVRCNNGSEAFQHTSICHSLSFLPY